MNSCDDPSSPTVLGDWTHAFSLSRVFIAGDSGRSPLPAAVTSCLTFSIFLYPLLHFSSLLVPTLRLSVLNLAPSVRMPSQLAWIGLGNMGRVGPPYLARLSFAHTRQGYVQEFGREGRP